MQVPGILPQLQKSVQAILLGRAQLPDWFNCGVRAQSHTIGFPLPPVAGQFGWRLGGYQVPPVAGQFGGRLSGYRVPTALCGRSVCGRLRGYRVPPVAGQWEMGGDTRFFLWQVSLWEIEGIQGSSCGRSVGWRLRGYKVPTVSV